MNSSIKLSLILLLGFSFTAYSESDCSQNTYDSPIEGCAPVVELYSSGAGDGEENREPETAEEYCKRRYPAKEANEKCLSTYSLSEAKSSDGVLVSDDIFDQIMNEKVEEYVKVKILKEEALEAIDCGKIIRDKDVLVSIKDNNNVSSIVSGELSPESQFTNLNSCKTSGYFKKENKFYNFSGPFPKLLTDEGDRFACAKMAIYKNDELSYSCQDILDQRSRCSEGDGGTALLPDEDIKLLVSEADKRVKAIKEIEQIKISSDENVQQHLREKNPPAATLTVLEKQNFESVLESKIDRYLEEAIASDYPMYGTGVSEEFDPGSSNVSYSDKKLNKLNYEITDIYGILRNSLKSGVNISSNTYAFKSQGACEEILLSEFQLCMGDKRINIDKVSKNYKVKDLPRATSFKSHVKSKGMETNAIEFKVSTQKCNGSSQCSDSKGNEHEIRLSNSFYQEFNYCNSVKHVMSVVDQGTNDFQVGEYYESYDRRFKCVNLSPWTMDYKSCKNAVTFYDGAAVGTVAMDTANTAIVAGRNNKIQQDALNETVDGGDQLNAGLNAQAKSLTAREQAETRKAVFSGSKVAALTTILLSYKTPNKFRKDCVEGQEELAGGDIHFCVIADAIRSGSPNAKEIFANQQVRKEMWSEVAKASVETTLAIMAATQASKQRADVNKYKKMFEEQKDESKIESPQIGLDYCKYNPASPQCKQRGPRVSNGGEFGYGNVGLQGQGQNLAITDKDDAFGEYNDDVIADGSSDAIDDLGNLIDSDNADSFSNDFNAPGAGEATKGTAIGSGGGGGGAPGGGGGGGSAPARAKAGQAKYAVTSKAGDYGKRGGSVKYSGGGSVKSKKDASNPFSKMFGSKSSRNIASDVKDIAPAHSGLFDKISKRYERVATDKRLLDLSNVKK